MRYTSAVVLSTLAVAQGATIHNRHASFHARREAEVIKRNANEPINWEGIAFDLKDVKWDQINWSSVFASSAASKPTPTPEEKKVVAAATPTPTPKQETPTPAPSPKAVESAKPAEPSSKAENHIGDFVSELFNGVSDIAGKLGAKVGRNDKADNGGIWVGKSSAWGMEVTNAGSQDAVFYCWKANGFSGMSINVNVPEISVGLKPGQKVDLSFAPNVPAACAPATKNSKLGNFGGIAETWAEVTFGQWGAFDVSRNVNMKGSSISMKGSKCTSDMSTCVFKCADLSADSCEKGYTLDNCSAGNGGGGGFDPVMQGVGGGCAMGSDGERISVSFS